MRVILAFVFIAGFLASLIARFPLALALSFVEMPVRYESVVGTIWDGEVHRLNVEGQPVGDVSLQLSALPLLTGSVKGTVRLEGDGLVAASGFVLSGRVMALRDGRANVALDRLRLTDTLGQRLRGRFEAEIDEIVFARGACRSASLRVSTDAVAETLGAFATRGFDMAGQGSCDGDDLLVPLEGEGPDARVLATLRLSGNGRYLSGLTVTPQRRDLGLFLANYGFDRDGDSYTTSRTGYLYESL
ncbi:MAG: type II secretion system protein N [Pseudomonadota bacterium]